MDTWGLTNVLMATKMKVRLLEELIDKAQLNQVRPNQELEQEIGILRQMYNSTLDDVQRFVSKREKIHWRTWDKRRKHNFSLSKVLG